MRWRAALVVVLALCAAPLAALAAPADYQGASGGWFVFSVTTGTGNPFNTAMVVRFRALDVLKTDYSETSLPINLFRHKADVFEAGFDPGVQGLLGNAGLNLINGATKTDVFCVRLAEGDYEYYETDLTANSGNISYRQRFTSRTVRFHVTAGRTTYLGNIVAAPVSRPGLFGVPVFTKWVWIVGDQGARDIQLAGAKESGALGPVDHVLKHAPAEELPPWLKDDQAH